MPAGMRQWSNRPAAAAVSRPFAPASAWKRRISPAKIAPVVVWLCTDRAANVNGRTFHIGGDAVSRLSEPARERVLHHHGGWTLDALDAIGPTHLTDDLANEYTLDDRPDLQVFDE